MFRQRLISLSELNSSVRSNTSFEGLSKHMSDQSMYTVSAERFGGRWRREQDACYFESGFIKKWMLK